MNKKQKSMKFLIPIIIVVVIAIVISLVFVFNRKDIKAYDNKLEQAQKYVEELDYKRAETAYLEAIKIDSKQSKAYLKLADIYVKQNKIDKFINMLEKGIKNVDKDDRRVVRVEITDKAKEVLKIHDEFHENLIDRALEDLNLSDNEVLIFFHFYSL